MTALETWMFIAAVLILIGLYRIGFGSPWPVVAIIVGLFAVIYLTIVVRL